MNNKKIIFSGIQPSGNIHLGNYLGAIRNWIKLQDQYQSIFCIVDLHALTKPQNPKELSQKTLEIAKIYLASGINPEKSIVFIQSQVKEHSELMWLLNTITNTGDLFKMTQFKDKTAKEKERETIQAGLLNYPILMAADILLYETNLVPVGEDQIQHIELTRKVARKFNKKFGETFFLPQNFTQKEGKRIMGLNNPEHKMSKSASSEYNWIGILDKPDIIQKKIMKAVTDSQPGIEYSDKKPALKNLINIFSLITDKNPKKIASEYKNRGYKEFKEDLAQAIINFLQPIQVKYHQISDQEIKEKLTKGSLKAQKIAGNKIKEVKQKMGLVK